MHDTERVSLAHAVERLHHVPDRDVRRETALLLEHLCEVLALEELEDHVRVATLFVDVEDPNDVVVLDVRRGATLVHEAPRRFFVLAIGEHHLDGDRMSELHVTRGEHRAHAALSDDALERVLARDDVARFGQLGGAELGHRFQSLGLRSDGHKEALVAQVGYDAAPRSRRRDRALRTRTRS